MLKAYRNQAEIHHVDIFLNFNPLVSAVAQAYKYYTQWMQKQVIVLCKMANVLEMPLYCVFEMCLVYSNFKIFPTASAPDCFKVVILLPVGLHHH